MDEFAIFTPFYRLGIEKEGTAYTIFTPAGVPCLLTFLLERYRESLYCSFIYYFWMISTSQ